MNVRSRFPLLAGALLLATAAQAQLRSVTPVPTRPAPTAPQPATAPGNTQPMPATPPSDGTVLMPATAAGSVHYNNSTTVMGAGGGPDAPPMLPSSPGAYTALQLAESFQRADANRDGELSRAEFQHLTIAPASFEEMDRDHNGVVTRSEYDDASR